MKPGTWAEMSKKKFTRCRIPFPLSIIERLIAAPTVMVLSPCYVTKYVAHQLFFVVSCDSAHQPVGVNCQLCD